MPIHHQLLKRIRLRRIKSGANGFSIIELVTVVSVLGILTTVSLLGTNGQNGALSWGKRAKVDSIKSKLNSTAASCLQDIRSGRDPTETINSGIISDELLKSDGYKISTDMNTCSSLMVEAIDSEDPHYFPLGFTIADGSLTKFAVPTSDVSKQSCEAWAGSNCKAGEDLVDLIDHNKAVAAAKTSCNNDFYSWLNGNPPTVAVGDGKRNRWDINADSNCARIPPANKDNTCTTSGCTLETWAFEGTIVAGETGYKEALERKYGKICSDKLSAILETKQTGGPEIILECGANRELWFFEGVDQGSEEEMNKLICQDKTEQFEDASNPATTGLKTIPECGAKTFYYCLGEDKKTEDLMNDCVSQNKIASCQIAIDNAVADNYEGEFIPERGGPGICSVPVWICNRLKYDTEASFKETDCGDVTCPPLDQPPSAICTTFPSFGICKEWAECNGLL